MATRSDARAQAGMTNGEPLWLEGAIEVDSEPALEQLRNAGRRFSALVRAIENPDQRTRGLEWTVAEVAAHTMQAFHYDLDNIRGSGEPYPIVNGDFIESGTLHNKQLLEQEPERDPWKIAERFDAVLEEFVTEAGGRDPAQPVRISQGATTTVATVVGILLGELILHGLDIAQTAGKSLTIEPEAARQAVYSTAATLSLAVNMETTRDLDVRLELRIRGGKRFVVHIDHGSARTEPVGGKVDVVISGDPVAYLLVGYGRQGPGPQVLKGKMLSWGRRPLLATKLPVFFRQP